MRPKARKRIGILALVPISVLSVASLFSTRSAVRISFVGLDTSYFSLPFYSNESAVIQNASFASNESAASSLFPELEGSEDSGASSFSACLLVMDDNFRLPEWLAYHYYMMNLRHVVVAVDPHSRTYPSVVLDRWKDRIHIDIWTNDTFVATRNCSLDMSRSDNSLSAKKDAHRCRQIEFYQSCARHLKALNRTWTSFHDIDEYLVVASTSSRNISHSDLVQQPGAIPKLIQRYASNRSADHTSSARDETNWPYWLSQPCFTVPRVLFSAAEMDGRGEDAPVSKHVPSFVKASQFDTLRYRYQATPAGGADGLAKSIMDVSRLPAAFALSPTDAKAAPSPPPPGNAHRPFRDWCTHAWPKPQTLPLVVHHYLGSWEAFSFRDDARRGGLRTVEKWRERSALMKGGINDDARGWMSGFVRRVGEGAARELLQDAGLPPDYKKPDNETALWVAQT